MRIVIAAAVNDEAVLTSNLLASPDVAGGHLPLHVYRGFPTSGLAYNRAIAELGESCDWLVFAHQDVYLPAGFAERLTKALSHPAIDETAAVFGLFGLTTAQGQAGTVWCNAARVEYAGNQPTPAEAVCLDEYLVGIRPASGIRFDEALPSYHLYGTDIVLIAHERGFKTWLLNVPVVHNARPVVNLDRRYRQAWFYMRGKWQGALPIANLICTITRSPVTLWLRYLQVRLRHRFRTGRGAIEDDAREIARRQGYEPAE